MTVRPRWWLALVTVLCAGLTWLISGLSLIEVSYRSPSLHVAVETAAALISLVAAQLIYGRFRRSLEQRDLALAAALAVFAATNLCFSAIPSIAQVDLGAFATWAPVGGGFLATGLFVAAAFLPPSRVHRPRAAARRLLVICVAALAVITLAVLLAGDALPRAIAPGLSPDGIAHPRVVGNATILAMQLVTMVLFSLAAIGFGLRAERTGDPLLLLVAIAALFAAFARLNYFLFPSLYSEYFYTGDVLRLGFFVALLAGGMREIRLAQHELKSATLTEERRRLAREIHDGMAQDLAFIVQQGGELAGRPGASEQIGDIVTAARRALDDTRGAISALVRPTDEPLARSITRAAKEAADREGVAVRVAIADEVELPAATRDALLRIVREAVTNAARHGAAQLVTVELVEQPELALRIVDDGRGFDPAALADRSGRRGVTGMRERAEELGGELQVRSQPGAGTQIEVLLP